MTGFLEKAGWAEAQAEPLAGDASARRYTRLRQAGQSAILMQDPGGDVAQFARLARHLLSIGLSAPRILAEDNGHGLLLLEDLGDGLIAHLANPREEQRLYLLATDALVALHRHPPPDLPRATPDRLCQMIDLAYLHYANAPEALTAAQAALLPLLQDHAQPCDVMILRDYHGENILELPDRQGPARAGLLDFQDAMQGHRAYDLASLLRDARREVQPATVEACLTRYTEQTGQNPDRFRAAFAVQSLQRNLRILGVFARLAAQGKPRYLEFLPQVWTHLHSDLANPALAPMRPHLAVLPAPDAAQIERLRQQCPTP